MGQVERRRSKDDVVECFGENAAHPQHDGRTELWVAYGPGDQLARAGDHRGHENLDVAVFRLGRSEQGARRVTDGRSIGDAEADESALGLVGDALAVQLEHDGKAERRGGGDGGVRINCVELGRKRQAESGEQLLGRSFGQRLRSDAVRHEATPAPR